jgi:hypothetical protein
MSHEPAHIESHSAASTHGFVRRHAGLRTRERGSVRYSTLTRVERKQLNAELERWGDWWEKRGHFDGYPSINILESFIGSDLGAPGHRILCLEMPLGVYCTHHRVLRLPELEREAVWIWYVPRVKANGQTYTLYEKCDITGLNEWTLRKRVQFAKLRIMGIDPLRPSKVTATLPHAREAVTS